MSLFDKEEQNTYQKEEVKMNQLISTNQNDNDEIVVSGRELHEFLEVGSQYTKWFERMTEYGFDQENDYLAVNQKRLTAQGNTTSFVDHQIKLDMAKEIAMLQRSEKGKQARRYFIKVEKMWNDPEMIVKRALDLQQKKIIQLEVKISEEKKYTDFGKVVSLSDGAINVGAFSKLIYDEHGIKIGRNKLMEWLRDKGYLMKIGRERNFPKQQYIEQGLFKLVPTIIQRSEGDVQGGTTLVTGKGQVRLLEVLLREFARLEA